MKRCLQVLGIISFPLLLAGAAAQQPACPFSFGLVSKTDIDLHANNIYVDSFDSTDPTKSTNGQYDQAKRQPNGDVAVGGSLTNSVTNFASANIYGVVFLSPSGSVTMGPNGSIGPSFSNPDTTVTQAMADGWIGTNCSLYVPDVSLPSGFSSASNLGTINGNTTINGSGYYTVDSINLSGSKTLTITNGNVNIYVTGDMSLAGNATIVVAPGATLTIYVAGSVFIAGNGVANVTGQATRSRFYGLPSSTTWSITANTPWAGVVWAPEAALVLGGGDKSGAFIAGSMMFGGNGNMHYDESLGIKVCSSASGGWVDGITGIALTGSDVSISFPVASLRRYTVEYIDNLTASNWTGLATTNTSSCTGEIVRVMDSGGSSLSQRFYRLRIHPQLLDP